MPYCNISALYFAVWRKTIAGKSRGRVNIQQGCYACVGAFYDEKDRGMTCWQR